MRSVPLLLAASLSWLACDDPESLSPSAAQDELVDRNWIDVWPEDKDDHLHVYRFVPAMGGGVFQDRTVFEGSFELFTFSASGDTIRFTFPGKDEEHETGYRIEAVDGPDPFTHKLVLDSSPRGPAEYYGWNERSTRTPFTLDP